MVMNTTIPFPSFRAAAALLALASAGLAAAPPPAVDIWTAHGLERIRPGDGPGEIGRASCRERVS